MFSAVALVPFLAALVSAQGPIESITSAIASGVTSAIGPGASGASSLASSLASGASSAASSLSSGASSVRSSMMSSEMMSESGSRTVTSPNGGMTQAGMTNSEGWAMPTAVPVVEGMALGLAGIVAAMI